LRYAWLSDVPVETTTHGQVAADRTGSELRRVLGLRDLVLLIVGTVIGSGIFLVPSAVLRSVGNSVPAALLIWVLAGFLSLLGALTYGELSAMKPEAGGLYIYIRDCFGGLAGFLFGWILFFVVSTGSVATLAVAFSSYLGGLVELKPWEAKLVSLLMIGIIAVVNVRGTRQSANLQNLTTAIKVAAILAMAAGLLLFSDAAHTLKVGIHPNAGLGSIWSGLGTAMVSVLWAYEGWQYATFTAGETIHPQRNFPLAFLVGIGILIGVYLLANVGYVAALGADGVANSSRVAASALATLSPVLSKFVTVAILISIFSAAHSITLTAPRVFYAMAKDGVFFQQLAQVHPHFGTPALAILAATVWASLLAITGTFEQLLTYVVFVGWAFYALAAASIFVYRRRKTAETVYRVPGYPWTPSCFIAIVVLFVANTIVRQPLRAFVGTAIALTGVPAYFAWRRLARVVPKSG
jgi:APA family basic amino acid/polyamine antiporter